MGSPCTHLRKGTGEGFLGRRLGQGKRGVLSLSSKMPREVASLSSLQTISDLRLRVLEALGVCVCVGKWE